MKTSRLLKSGLLKSGLLKSGLLKSGPAAALVSAALVGCGGGNGYEADTPGQVVITGVPTSAVASSAAYTDFARTLTNSETGTPLELSVVVTAPTSETASPQVL